MNKSKKGSVKASAESKELRRLAMRTSSLGEFGESVVREALRAAADTLGESSTPKEGLEVSLTFRITKIEAPEAPPCWCISGTFREYIDCETGGFALERDPAPLWLTHCRDLWAAYWQETNPASRNELWGALLRAGCRGPIKVAGTVPASECD